MAARTFTIDQLVTRLEALTDTENDAHISTAEKFAALNSAIAETWDLLIAAGLGEKYVKSQTFNTVAGQLEYVLQTVITAGDFYKISKLYVVESTSYLRPLQRVSPHEIQSFRAPISVVPMKLYYIPYSPVLTTGQSFDGINGWEEHTLMVAACAIKAKKEDSYSVYDARRRVLEERIKTSGSTDYGEPQRVVRKRRRTMNDPFMNYVTQLNCYGLRGDKLELYYAPGVTV